MSASRLGPRLCMAAVTVPPQRCHCVLTNLSLDDNPYNDRVAVHGKLHSAVGTGAKFERSAIEMCSKLYKY